MAVALGTAERREWAVPPPETAMWRYQATLPRLPVPDLGKTCVRYLRSVRPLLNDGEYKKTVSAVISFAVAGKGEELQRRLLARRDSKKATSWLAEWWNQQAYLTDREPVVFFVSYFYSFKRLIDIPPSTAVLQGGRLQCTVAAALVEAALAFKSKVENGSLEPDKVGGMPQCMSAYPFLFNSCRIPASPSDTVAVHYVGETSRTHSAPILFGSAVRWRGMRADARAHTHSHSCPCADTVATRIAVLRRGRIYSMSTHLSSGARMSKEELAEELYTIVHAADAAGDSPLPVGPLTGMLVCACAPKFGLTSHTNVMQTQTRPSAHFPSQMHHHTLNHQHAPTNTNINSTTNDSTNSAHTLIHTLSHTYWGSPAGSDRDKWAAARAELCRYPSNRQALLAVEKAAFVLCLDHDCPPHADATGAGDRARQMWHGGIHEESSVVPVEHHNICRARRGVWGYWGALAPSYAPCRTLLGLHGMACLTRASMRARNRRREPLLRQDTAVYCAPGWQRRLSRRARNRRRGAYAAHVC